MTVGELIKNLERFDEDVEVMVFDPLEGFMPINSLEHGSTNDNDTYDVVLIIMEGDE
jgi:hypothetical protein